MSERPGAQQHERDRTSMGIEVRDLDVRFGDVVALGGVSLRVEPGVICGLLGRNGAGKSTLLAVLAAYRRPTGGTVTVDGEDPYEHARLMSEICLVREQGDFEDGTSVRELLQFAAELRPRWDAELAGRLVERFEIPVRAKARSLSRGQRSALAVTVGLASRAPLTMFDEPHLGMDVAARYAFYDELLADYAARPRTIVLSTHLIDEAAGLLEDVVILDRGRVVVHDAADRLRGRGVQLTGRATDVDALVGGQPVLSERLLGPTKSVVTLGLVDDDLRVRADAAGVDVDAIPLQELFVHLTTREATP